MPPLKVLVINASAMVGGDTEMLLLGLPSLDTARFTTYAASVPRGRSYDALNAIPHIQVINMEFGGSDMHPPMRWPTFTRTIEALTSLLQVVQLIRREQIDVLYTMDRSIGMPIAYAASVLTGCPLVLNAQTTVYLENSRIHQRVLRHARLITVSSENMRRAFLPYVRTPDQMVMIPNAIRIERYDPNLSGEPVRNELAIPADATVVLLAGRLNPWKGQSEFVRAANLLLPSYPETYFLLAGGDGAYNYQATLQRMIDEFGIGQRVRLLGNRTDLPHVIAASDIGTMPSHEEPFGLVALEAMVMGKPVVATRAGGVPEFLVDGEMGILIPPRDHHALATALGSLIADPKRRVAMGVRGRQQAVQNYNASLYGQRIAAVLETAARSSRQSARNSSRVRPQV